MLRPKSSSYDPRAGCGDHGRGRPGLESFRQRPEGVKRRPKSGHSCRRQPAALSISFVSEAQKGAALETPSQISKFVADSTKTGFFDWLQSYFVNALISGPATHGTYAIGKRYSRSSRLQPRLVPRLSLVPPEGHNRRDGTDRVLAHEIGSQLYGIFGQGAAKGGGRHGMLSAPTRR